MLSFEDLNVKIGPAFTGYKTAIFDSNPRRWLCKASNLRFLLELDTNNLNPKETGTDLDTKLLKAKHMS